MTPYSAATFAPESAGALKGRTLLSLSALTLAGCAYLPLQALDERRDMDGDGVSVPADCDDADPALSEYTFYSDGDGDGFGGASTVTGCRAPDGYVAEPGDCSDDDPAVNPSASEICNSIDDDCDGVADEDVEVPIWYLDSDGDGFGNEIYAVTRCAPPTPDYTVTGGDCDDGDPDVRPGVEEVCDEIDNDCDGLLDDADPDAETSTWYWDGDGDGAGVPGVMVEACSAPGGYVSAERVDCDDDDPTTWIDAPELCDGVDNDCDEETGEEGTVTLDGVSAFDAIQGALDAATDGSTIDVCEGTFTENLEVWAAVSLQSRHGPDVTTLTAAKDGATVAILSTVDVSIAGFTITGGTGHPAAAVAMGGGVYAGPAAHLTISDCVITGNTADYGGGVAQWATGAGLTITDTTIADNTATDGAGLFIQDSTAELTGLTVEGNVASQDGGGFFLSYSTTILASSTITANSAGNDGGGLADAASILDFDEVTASGNTAGDSGGGLHLIFSSGALDSMTLNGNSAAGEGGAALSLKADLTFTDGEITENRADDGGGLYFMETTVVVETSAVVGNRAYESGGGLWLYTSDATLQDITLSENTAGFFGGGAYALESEAALSGVEISSNRAYLGAGVLLQEASMTLSSCSLQRNAADDVGGGAHLVDGELTSESSDWGQGGADNSPDDVSILGGARYPNFGAAESFYCEGTTCR